MKWSNNTKQRLAVSVNRKRCSSKGVHFIIFNLTIHVLLSAQRINVTQCIQLPVVESKFKLLRSIFNIQTMFILCFERHLTLTA